jgi:hypothetical protein
VDAGPLGIGPHLAVQIDDQPPLRISDHRPSDPGDQLLVNLPPLAPGSHRITAYAALPWGEAVKDPGATARLRLHSVAANPLSLPTPGSPELIPVSPAELGGGEPLLLDWLLYDAPLQHLRQGDDSWRLRVSINGDSFLVDQNAPLWLRGWHQGSNALQLELVDGRGEPLNPPYNSLVRQVTLAGGPPPRWLGTRLSSQELAVYLGQIPSAALAPAKRPAAPKNAAARAEEPLAKPGAVADQNSPPVDAAKGGLAGAANADTANAGAAKAETATADTPTAEAAKVEAAKVKAVTVDSATADAEATLADPLGEGEDSVDFFDASTSTNANTNTIASANNGANARANTSARASANRDQAESNTTSAIPPGESAPRASRPEPSQARPHEAADVNTAGNDVVDAEADEDADADAADADTYAGTNADVDAGADADAGTGTDIVNPAQINAAPAAGQAVPSQIDPAVAEPEFSQPELSEPALTKSALADRLIGRLIGRDRPTAQEQPQGDADQAASDPASGGGPLGGLRRRLAR